MIPQNSQHAAQRLCRAPKKLVAHGEPAQKFRAHCELVKAADRHVESPRNSRGSKAANARILVIWDHACPFVAAGEHVLDFVERDIFLKLDAHRLAVTA